MQNKEIGVREAHAYGIAKRFWEDLPPLEDFEESKVGIKCECDGKRWEIVPSINSIWVQEYDMEAEIVIDGGILITKNEKWIRM